MYRHLWNAYKQAFTRKDVKDHNEALVVAVNSPCPRYWLSPREAARQISRMEKGMEPTYKKAFQKEMIQAVYQQYKRLKEKRSFKGCSTLLIASYAVHTPAPRFYISLNRARRIISEMRRGCYNFG